jgi:predicted nucleic acid-binding protein
MRVFSDTSPISCLASLDRLELLESFGGVKIVPAVEAELSRHPSERARNLIAQAFERGLLVRELVNTTDPVCLLLEHELDLGEAQVLATAKATHADLVLLDERDGRKWARRLELSTVGTLGILLMAKREGRLNSVRQTMSELTRDYGFSIDPTLLDRALKQVGES